MRTGDNFAFHIRPPFPDPARAGRQTVIGTFFLTRDAAAACSAVLRGLAGFHLGKASPFLLTGPPGVGKTHLVRYLINLLDHPEDRAWDALESHLRRKLRPDVAVPSLYLDVPPEPSVDLGIFLAGEMGRHPRSTVSVPTKGLVPEEFASWMDTCLPASLPGIIVIDHASRRWRTASHPLNQEAERDLIHALVRACSEKGAFVLVVDREEDVIPGWSRDHRQTEGGDSSRRVIGLGPGNIAQVVSGALASKDAHQRARILQVMTELKEKLPGLGPSLEVLIDLYPVHPLVFDALFDLRAVFPSFSPLQFVQLAMKASRTRPAQRLITLDWLLDYILADFQKCPVLGAAAEAYGDLLRSAIPRLDPQLQQKATVLLKGIAVLSISRIRPATAATLADALLLYDEHNALPSYSLAAAILGEMEVHGGQYLTAEGSLRQRQYQLVGVPLRVAAGATGDVPPIQSRARSPGPAPLPAERPLQSSARQPSAEEAAELAQWLVVLTGNDGLAQMGTDGARRALLEWWATRAEADSATMASYCARLPESLLTTKLSTVLGDFVRVSERVEAVLRELGADAIDVVRAAAKVAAICNRDQDRLREWRNILEAWPGLPAWLHHFAHACAYVYGAYPTGEESTETLRVKLLAASEDPLRFLEPRERQEFDRGFEEFKQAYADYYCRQHLRTLFLVDRGKEGPAVDGVALKNLELLSGLHYASQSYLNRVRVIGRWIQANQCSLPVRQILDQSPRCYCNFNPGESRYLGEFVHQINGVIQEGIDYFRSILRACKAPIIQEIKNMGVDDQYSKQMASLFGNGPTVPLKPRSIEILNRVIRRHSTEFLGEIRRQG